MSMKHIILKCLYVVIKGALLKKLQKRKKEEMLFDKEPNMAWVVELGKKSFKIYFISFFNTYDMCYSCKRETKDCVLFWLGKWEKYSST